MDRYWYQIRWDLGFYSWFHLDSQLFALFFPGRERLSLDDEITFAGRKGVVIGWNYQPNVPSQIRIDAAEGEKIPDAPIEAPGEPEYTSQEV